jgi:hypothetical protein
MHGTCIKTIKIKILNENIKIINIKIKNIKTLLK